MHLFLRWSIRKLRCVEFNHKLFLLQVQTYIPHQWRNIHVIWHIPFLQRTVSALQYVRDKYLWLHAVGVTATWGNTLTWSTRIVSTYLFILPIFTGLWKERVSSTWTTAFAAKKTRNRISFTCKTCTVRIPQVIMGASIFTSLRCFILNNFCQGWFHSIKQQTIETTYASCANISSAPLVWMVYGTLNSTILREKRGPGPSFRHKTPTIQMYITKFPINLDYTPED